MNCLKDLPENDTLEFTGKFSLHCITTCILKLKKKLKNKGTQFKQFKKKNLMNCGQFVGTILKVFEKTFTT